MDIREITPQRLKIDFGIAGVVGTFMCALARTGNYVF